MTPLEAFYENLPSAQREVLLACRAYLQSLGLELVEQFKWELPVFAYQGKHVCYLACTSKSQQPYIAFPAGKHLVHPLLQSADRVMVRHLDLDPDQDLPREAIADCLRQQIAWTQRTGKAYAVRK